jgi:L,D-transpeptidase catalytic domain/Putative peptidoglycan binding domain
MNGVIPISGFLILTLALLAMPVLADELILRNEAAGVRIEIPWKDGKLWRGYQEIILSEQSNRVQFSPVGQHHLDNTVPSGTWIHYLAQHDDGREAYGKIWRPKEDLPTLLYPRIQVDKLNYTLAVLDEERVVKRYPISLGGDPLNRKFCYDRLSTPEGLYNIVNVQPQATFYRAYDIDYPNEIDGWRHQLCREAGIIAKGQPIGGEIQIHGEGIDGNWTHGCMGLRNRDMDELFSAPRLRKGTEVFITGTQIKEEDRIWLIIPPTDYVFQLQDILNREGYSVGDPDGEMNEATAIALGRLQRVSGLEISCQLDSETRAFLLDSYKLRW